ncbi:glycosyltransferase family 61 protein [Labilibacter marinus]|uniref:glycosyltransferase family 61 protein n=1 Tax=Labilibacter marinus TaxID=1477105 RepID=UPI00094F832C|nr:glycosyltransferase family 61 protein [Labilibacter marinus]
MQQYLYKKNNHHLKVPEINNYWNINIPSHKIVPYNKTLITPTNHLFVKGRYIPTGLYKSFDNKQLSFIQKTYLYIKSKYINKKIRFNDNIIWVYDSWSGNYYHWLCETLPRIWHLHKHNPIASVIIPNRFKKFTYIKESLHLLEIEPTFIDETTTLIADKVYTIKTEPYWGIINPEFQQELAFNLKKNALVSQEDCGRRIYISRKKAKYRKVVNEDKIIPILNQFNYEIINAEDLTFTQQIKLFSETTSLIALHGAGHTNLMFMPPHSTVLEIRNKKIDSQPFCYFELSNIFSITWNYISSKAIGKVDNFNDIEVDVQQFNRKLKELHL